MASRAARLDTAVRRASQDDVPELVRLDGLAREHFMSLRGGEQYLRATARTRPVEDSLRGQLDADDALVLLGLVGETAVGYAVAELQPHPDGLSSVMVTELFVEKEFRDIGVGHRLMNELTAWAEHHGASGIDAHAMPGDRSTKNFFEAFGLVARAIVVRRELL